MRAGGAAVVVLVLLVGCSDGGRLDRAGPDAPAPALHLTLELDRDVWERDSLCEGDGPVGPEAGGAVDAPEAIDEVVALPEVDATVVTDDECPTYPALVPSTGPIASVHASCGLYTSPVPTPEALASVAKGAVWIAFRPDLDADSVERVREAAASASHVLAAPHDDLPAPIVLTGWGRQLLLDSADDPRLDLFLNAFVQGPTTPEPGGACHFGTGDPEVVFRAPR